jgi:hypothetical protein
VTDASDSREIRRSFGAEEASEGLVCDGCDDVHAGSGHEPAWPPAAPAARVFHFSAKV